MANYAYLSLWCRNFSAEKMLAHFARLLALFPISEHRAGFYSLTVRGISFHEAPLLEQDNRTPVTAAEALVAAAEFLHEDFACEMVGYWDLWQSSSGQEQVRWLAKPSPVEFACYGPEFEEGLAAENGHFCLQLGFEHLYTGHAGLLLDASRGSAPGSEALEREFVRAMQDAATLAQYREKTVATVRKLLGYVAQLERHLPLERRRLWSEGESDFEARLRQLQSG